MKNNYLKRAFNLFKINFLTVIEFELIYKIISFLVFIPIMLFCFKWMMKITSFTYITNENVFSFITNPGVGIFLFMAIIVLTIITMFDIVTLIVIYDQSYQNKKIKVFDAIKISIKRFFSLLKIKNILVCLLIILFLPFFKLGVGSIIFSLLNIPIFIKNYLLSNFILIILVGIILVLITIIIIKWIYSIYYMILERNTLKDSRRKSEDLIRDSIIKDLFKNLLIQIIIFVIYLVILIIGITLITQLYKYITNQHIESILITIVWVFTTIFIFILIILSNSFTFAVISSLYYGHKLNKNEEIININSPKDIKENKLNKHVKTIIRIIIIIILMFGSILTYQIVSGETNLDLEYAKNIEITAHRGASLYYPENTMSAFIGAVEMNANWIELDVHQTKDQKLVVTHDANLKRVTGVNKKISDTNYADIEKLDAGSFFSDAFKGEKIPLLEDVIKYAKDNNIKLNIELKPTGNEIDFERQVIKLINKYNYKDNCVIASFNYNILTNTKKIDSSITTVYVMSLALGNILDLVNADIYSIEASNINNELVNLIHDNNKRVFVWTINDDAVIRNMINYNVDNIITDDVKLVREIILENKSSNIINELVRLLN